MTTNSKKIDSIYRIVGNIEKHLEVLLKKSEGDFTRPTGKSTVGKKPKAKKGINSFAVARLTMKVIRLKLSQLMVSHPIRNGLRRQNTQSVKKVCGWPSLFQSVKNSRNR